MCPTALAVASYKLPAQGTSPLKDTGSRAGGMECPAKPVVGASRAEGS